IPSPPGALLISQDSPLTSSPVLHNREFSDHFFRAPLSPFRSDGFLIHQLRILADLPRQPPFIQGVHERIRIEFFHIIYALFLPCSGHHHHGSDHRGNSCRISNCLRSYFPVALLMVACIIYVEFLFLSVFLSYEDTSDICLTLCPRAKRRRIRQHCFEELQ